MLTTPSGGSPSSTSFRKGKVCRVSLLVGSQRFNLIFGIFVFMIQWTPEEEAYLMAIVRNFNAGLINIPAGKSLRSLLSEKLNWYDYSYDCLLEHFLMNL